MGTKVRAVYDAPSELAEPLSRRAVRLVSHCAHPMSTTRTVNIRWILRARWASTGDQPDCPHFPSTPSPLISSSHPIRCFSSIPSMEPMIVDRTGPMPQNQRVLRLRLLRL